MLTAHTLWIAHDLAWPEAVDVALLMQVLLFCDSGEAAYRDGWETYTCCLGILAGGRN